MDARTIILAPINIEIFNSGGCVGKRGEERQDQSVCRGGGFRGKEEINCFKSFLLCKMFIFAKTRDYF